MRWIKHLTAARRDEKIAALIAKGGHRDYGIWWMLVETVAESIAKGDTVGAVTYPIPAWGHTLLLHSNGVRPALDRMGVTGLIKVSYQGEFATVEIPNILKYRDEYASRKNKMSGQAPDKLPSKIQIQNTDTDTDTDKEKRRGGETPPPPRVSSKGKFTPPTIDEVKALWDARGYVRPFTEPVKFIAHYESNGWKVGKNPMRDWSAAAAGWNSRAIERDGIDCRRSPAPDHQIGTIGRDEPPEPTPEEIAETYRRELARVDLDITDWEGRRADTPNRETILAGLKRRREEIVGRLSA